MKVSDAVKNEYHKSSVHKNVSVYFPELDLSIENSNIYSESLILRESILEKDNIEFVGCISSMFSITISGLKDDIKGKRIEVSIGTDGTLEEPIPLFHGVVDSVVMQSNKRSKKITAYDELYTKGNVELSQWYNSLVFPITLKAFRDSLFQYIGLAQEEKKLPNDEIMIEKKYDPKTLKAWNVMKAVCQINGAFGIINRQNRFEYRILSDLIDTYAYPSTFLFPSQNLFPFDPDREEGKAAKRVDEMKTESFGFYKTVDYEEFEVKPVDKLTIRQNESDEVVSFGNGINNYIIQGNMFTLGKREDELEEIAKRIYSNVRGIYYHPFKSDNSGLPYIECGLDAVSFFMKDYNTEENGESRNIRNFYVFSRELTGIQNLMDHYSANGEEYQTEFVTDLQTQIDMIKADTGNMKEWIGDYTYDRTTIDDKIGSIGGAGNFNVVSTSNVPSSYEPNTLYLVRGEVFIQ